MLGAPSLTINCTRMLKLPSKPIPRKPGQRAGLTREKVIAAALGLVRQEGTASLSIRAVAAKLKVGPTAIHNHFPGGLGDLRKGVARRALEDLSPPFQPNQPPASYLQNFLRNSLTAFREWPSLGPIVACEVSSDPLLSATFAERIGAMLLALGGEKNVVHALEIFIARWSGFIVLEAGSWGRSDQNTAKARWQKAVSQLSPTEFPVLSQALGNGAATFADRGSSTYVEQVVDAMAAAVVADLGGAG
jgi:TetR/AcrR family transcriptional regulator, tetracycline repressor protein